MRSKDIKQKLTEWQKIIDKSTDKVKNFNASLSNAW